MNEEHGDNFFIELLKVAVPVVLIVVLVRFFVAQPFIVSGASMQPTFATGQYLLVDELSYRFSPPERGDIIIFKYPKDLSQYFIKRIIGLPGETIDITPDAVFLVGTNNELEKLNEPYLTNKGNGLPMTIHLTSDEYFVMGDNRPDSSDSRFWGPLPTNDIVGRALLRLYPFNVFAALPGKADVQLTPQAALSMAIRPFALLITKKT